MDSLITSRAAREKTHITKWKEKQMKSNQKEVCTLSKEEEKNSKRRCHKMLLKPVERLFTFFVLLFWLQIKIEKIKT